MKKILFLLVATTTMAAASFAQHTTPRFGTSVSSDNSGRTITQGFKSVAYAATVALKPNTQFTTVVVGQLTGAITVTATVTNAYAGDILRICFSADTTNRVVTFTTGFQSAGTVTVTASKYATVSFIFNGATWVELSRTVTT